MAGNFLKKKAKSGILGELEISGLLVLGDLTADRRGANSSHLKERNPIITGIHEFVIIWYGKAILLSVFLWIIPLFPMQASK